MLSKQTSIETGTGRQSEAWYIQTGNWSSLTHSVRVRLQPHEIKHLDHHFMKPGDSEKISDSSILHFVQNLGVLNVCAKGLHI